MEFLQRFVDAQDPVYSTVLNELSSGRKRTHWMWFVFPQALGLGRSEASQHYGIPSVDMAVEYLRHPVLGERLRECSAVLNAVSGLSATEIFGSVDTWKLQASMTLFSRVGGSQTEFAEVLDRYFGGFEHAATVSWVASQVIDM